MNDDALRLADATVTSYVDAITSSLPSPQPLEVGTFDAVGLVLQHDVYAAAPSPHDNVAAVDGIAVKAETARHASVTTPVTFMVDGSTQDMPDGHSLAPLVHRGQPLPYGCDAVVSLQRDIAVSERVVVTRPVRAGENVSTVGSDIAERQLLAVVGHIVTPADVAMFAAARVDRVWCVPAPRVVVIGVIADNGDLAGQRAAGSTRPVAMMIAAAVRELGAMVFLGEEVPASRDALVHALDMNLGRADLIVLAGACRDAAASRVAAVLAARGTAATVAVGVDGIETQVYGAVGTCPVVGVSNLPGAANREYELFLRPAIRHLQGRRDVARPVVPARLAGVVVQPPAGCDGYVAVRLQRGTNGWECVPCEDATVVSTVTVAQTDGYIRLSGGVAVPSVGEQVDVTLLAD